MPGPRRSSRPSRASSAAVAGARWGARSSTSASAARSSGVSTSSPSESSWLDGDLVPGATRSIGMTGGAVRGRRPGRSRSAARAGARWFRVPWRSGTIATRPLRMRSSAASSSAGSSSGQSPGSRATQRGSERLRADDPQRRRLRVADVAGDRGRTSSGWAGAARAAKRDPLGPPLAGDHDHPLGQLGAGRGGQHVGEHRPDERRAPRPVEGFEEPLLGGAEALHRDDRRGSHRSGEHPRELQHALGQLAPALGSLHQGGAGEHPDLRPGPGSGSPASTTIASIRPS